MKQCVNPECSSYQQGRKFPDADIICPRCGEPLQISDAQVDPNLYQGANPYGTFGVQLPKRVDNLYAFLGAVATLALVFLLIFALYQSGAIHPGTVGATGDATAISYPVSPAVQTARAIAEATRTAQPTPIGGLIISEQTPDASVAGGPPLPTAAPANSGGGSSGAARAILCTRIDAGQACNQVTSYGVNDGFYLAVQATFGQGQATSVRVRWYGPPNGEAQLLPQDQTVTPDHTGAFWVGFTLSPGQPWAVGIYRADVFLDNSDQRATYATWNVSQ